MNGASTAEPKEALTHLDGASILIRTKNEARNLAGCLTAVFGQEGVEFEVIVLDSGSTDGTVEIARQFPVRLMTMSQEEFTYGYALNAGFEAAVYPFLVALSGHSIPIHRRWLATLLSHFKDPRVVGVSGSEVNRSHPWQRGGPVTLTSDNFFTDPHAGFSNFNAALRREAWEALPFHENLAYGEDKEWAWQMVARGARIVIDHEAAVLHEHQESVREVWRRGHNEALGQSAWRGPRSYSLAAVVRLGAARAWSHLRRGEWEAGKLLGAFAYYHGRYTGFAEARRQPSPTGSRLLTRPRRVATLASGAPS